ncbi:MAG: hypothetical protein WDM96_03260 [Lacunisphaera sp.]
MSPFTSNYEECVGALGELRLIGSIRRWLGNASPAAPFGIGDDCAVIPPTRHHQLVTTDPVIHGSISTIPCRRGPSAPSCSSATSATSPPWADARWPP